MCMTNSVVKIILFYFHLGVIDVSWMPYELKIEKHKFATIIPKVMNLLRKRTMAKSMRSNSLFTVVQRTIAVKKYVKRKLFFNDIK